PEGGERACSSACHPRRSTTNLASWDLVLSEASCHLHCLGSRELFICSDLMLRVRQVAYEPVPGETAHFFQRPRFFEEMRGSGDDRKHLLGTQLGQCVTVHFNDRRVIATHDQQSGRLNSRQHSGGKIRPAASRHDGINALRSFGG